MSTFAIAYGPAHNIRYAALNYTAGIHAGGWRPIVWTRDVAKAEKFDAPDKAERWGAAALNPGQWRVVAIPPARTTPQPGGTPAAARGYTILHGV